MEDEDDNTMKKGWQQWWDNDNEMRGRWQRDEEDNDKDEIRKMKTISWQQ